MISTIRIFNELKETMDYNSANKIADIIGRVYEELANTVTKREFNNLTNIVQQLAEAQKRTEIKVGELTEAQKRTEIKMEEFAEAQKRTEIKMEEFAEAQKRTEIRMEEFAEAQKRTEIKMEEFAEAQKRTEIRMEEFAEAQKRTEIRMEEFAEVQKGVQHELRRLAQADRELKANLGGLSHTVGYRLEDESYKALPTLLKKDLGVSVSGPLIRDYIPIGNDDYLEVNIYGRCLFQGKEYVVLGEAKTQLKKKDVDEFIKRCEQVHRFLNKDQIRVLVTYNTSPQVRQFVKDKGINLYFSYQF